MDDLLRKYNDYLRLKDCKAEYILSNGQVVDFVYRKENFIHLIGLHKLLDINLIQMFNDKSNLMVNTRYIISRIRKGRFTDAMVRASVFYNVISERYENFSYASLSSLTYTDAVVDFDASFINSKIKSDYLLFEVTHNKEYNHLGIAMDSASNSRYIETFFHQSTDMYICGQSVVPVKRFTLYSPKGDIIAQDSF